MRFKKRVHETRIGASPLNNLHLLMHLLLKVLVERQYLSAPRLCLYNVETASTMAQTT
jgi:hypothetical protein